MPEERAILTHVQIKCRLEVCHRGPFDIEILRWIKNIRIVVVRAEPRFTPSHFYFLRSPRLVVIVRFEISGHAEHAVTCSDEIGSRWVFCACAFHEGLQERYKDTNDVSLDLRILNLLVDLRLKEIIDETMHSGFAVHAPQWEKLH